jgi:hypothetical protein
MIGRGEITKEMAMDYLREGRAGGAKAFALAIKDETIAEAQRFIDNPSKYSLDQVEDVIILLQTIIHELEVDWPLILNLISRLLDIQNP